MEPVHELMKQILYLSYVSQNKKYMPYGTVFPLSNLFQTEIYLQAQKYTYGEWGKEYQLK